MKYIVPKIVDLKKKDAALQIVKSLNIAGYAVFETMAKPEELLNLSKKFGEVMPHRDSDKRGITIIAPRKVDVKDSNLGFTNSELIPHTDGSGTPNPPDLLALYCVTPSKSGGDNFIIDGKELYNLLSYPDILNKLKASNSAIFGSLEALHFSGSIFNSDKKSNFILRFRGDDWVFILRR